jgi:protein SCO1/2
MENFRLEFRRFTPMHDPDLLENKMTLFGREVPAVYVGSAAVGLLLAITGAIILTVQAVIVHPHSIVIAEPYAPADFTLPLADGSGTFNSAEQRGKVTVYYFGFTSCPDVCPETMFNLKRTYDELTDAQREQVDIVFITIDWENDTPAKIEQYTNAFHEDFIGLAGTGEQIQPIVDAFKVQVYRAADGDAMLPGYRITHTDAAFVVDQSGEVVLRMAHAGDPDPTFMARDLVYVITGRIKTVQ